MANAGLPVTKARIERADLFRYDGSSIGSLIESNVITEVNLSQSIDASAFKGSIKVVDNIGLLETVPLRGEETLFLTIVANDLETRYDLELQVYRIDNVQIHDANDGISYYLHFVSKLSFEASKRVVTRSFSREGALFINEIAEKIFNDNYSTLSVGGVEISNGTLAYSILNTPRRFIVQPTFGRGNIIIPSYTPTEAMHFLTTRAYLENRGFTSCSFRFFETLEDFYFVSDEWLIKNANDEDNILNLYYVPQVSKDHTESRQQIDSIERIDYPQRIDTANDMYSGGYSNRILEIDFVRGQVRNISPSSSFNYLRDAEFLDMNGEPRTPDSYIHTEQFANDTFTDENGRRFLIFRDYASPGDNPGSISRDQYLGGIVSNRIAYRHHLNNTAINAYMKGRLDIYPGRVVNLEVSAFDASSNRGSNPQLSGNYLVYSTEHSIQYEELRTSVRLVKYDWSV